LEKDKNQHQAARASQSHAEKDKAKKSKAAANKRKRQSDAEHMHSFQKFCTADKPSPAKRTKFNRYFDLGKMDQTCKFCGAKFWLAEQMQKSSAKNHQFSLCCKNGRISLKPLHPPTKYLKRLLEGNDKEARFFQGQARAFNNCLAFSSHCAEVNDVPGIGPRVIKMHGST